LVTIQKNLNLFRYAAGGSLFDMSPENVSVASPFAAQTRWCRAAKGDACSLNQVQSEKQRLRMNENRPQNLFVLLFMGFAPGCGGGGDFELNSCICILIKPWRLQH